jgi:hypothetical protein
MLVIHSSIAFSTFGFQEKKNYVNNNKKIIILFTFEEKNCNNENKTQSILIATTDGEFASIKICVAVEMYKMYREFQNHITRDRENLCLAY